MLSICVVHLCCLICVVYLCLYLCCLFVLSVGVVYLCCRFCVVYLCCLLLLVHLCCLFFVDFVCDRCLRVELRNNDTGELLCAQEPVYGGTGVIDRPEFDETGYIATPPCMYVTFWHRSKLAILLAFGYLQPVCSFVHLCICDASCILPNWAFVVWCLRIWRLRMLRSVGVYLPTTR